MSLTPDRIFEICKIAIAEANASIPDDDCPHPLVGAVLVDPGGTILLKAHRGERPKRQRRLWGQTLSFDKLQYTRLKLESTA